MKIIGIGGTNGAGKDSAGEILAESDWLFLSVSTDLLIPELINRGEPLERKNMANLSSEWRRQLGMGAMVDKAVGLYEQKSKTQNYNGLVIASLRHPGEADRVHELGGRVVWLDADPKVRYLRVTARGQGAKDLKTYEEFIAEEQAELVSKDQAELNTVGVKQRADIFITNNSNNLEDLKKEVTKQLGI